MILAGAIKIRMQIVLTLNFKKRNDENYINVLNKKVILYIDEAMENISAADQEKLQSIEKMGVTIVNGLEELKGVLE